ncbi:MAG: C39 family peptidase [Chloroflexota bacterium]
MNRSPETLHAPPRLLLWLVSVVFFLLIVAALAGLSYFRAGQRIGAVIPFVAIAVAGVIIAAVGGALIFRKSLPRLMWLWVSLLAVIIVVALVGGGIFAYRSILPPRYQEQMLTEMPFMRAFLPPTPAGGAIPTVAAPTGGISPDDLLSLLPAATEIAIPEVVTQQAISPTEEATVEQVVLAPSTTPLPSTTPTQPPTLAATVAPTVELVPSLAQPTEAPEVAQQTSAVNRLPANRMYGFTYVRQGWNNCGPANITMALSHYGWRESQEFAASILKPVTEDKNVSPSEMVNFVRTQTQVSAITRMGGDMGLLKDLISANVPVIVETGYSLEGEDWLGHYQTIVGYDDTQAVFYVYDSWLGTGTGDTGLPERYSDFDSRWQAFNRTFIVIYEKDREGVVQQILGDRADVTEADQHALEVATAEATADRQNGFAWFNIGTSYTRLGDYERAAAAYDQARLLDLPFRMLWYQFGPFEAYYETGRYGDMEALISSNLNTAGNYVEETFYWQGKMLAAQGQSSEASAAFQRALAQNPNYEAAQTALNAL